MKPGIMSGEKFRSSGKGVAALIFRHVREMYPSLAIAEGDVTKLVIPSESRGSDVYFAADRFAAQFGLEITHLLSGLYQRLVHEHDNQWHDRTFYGIAQSDNSLLFRLVDDSTT